MPDINGAEWEARVAMGTGRKAEWALKSLGYQSCLQVVVSL